MVFAQFREESPSLGPAQVSGRLFFKKIQFLPARVDSNKRPCVVSYAKDEEKREYQTDRSFTKATTPVRDTTTYTLGADSFVRDAFYILPSAAPDGYWSVDDDITIYLNSVILFQDANVQTDAFAPISFQAKTGDQLRIVVSDTTGSCHYLTPLKINKAGVDTPLDGTYIRQVCDGGAPSSTPYFDKTFTLP
ncbi:MAG: hypothetical protein EBZ60_00965 [Betaproteobacteria bacterium]|nr:hypothetical protein [Betaproteobacteria bacterium]